MADKQQRNTPFGHRRVQPGDPGLQASTVPEGLDGTGGAGAPDGQADRPAKSPWYRPDPSSLRSTRRAVLPAIGFTLALTVLQLALAIAGLLVPAELMSAGAAASLVLLIGVISGITMLCAWNGSRIASYLMVGSAVTTMVNGLKTLGSDPVPALIGAAIALTMSLLWIVAAQANTAYHKAKKTAAAALRP